MQIINFLKKIPRSTYFLIILIAIAAFLRLYRISDTLVFLGDQGRDASIVYRLLHGDIALVGPTTSVGKIQLGPFYYYLMAPFLWLWHYNPVGPAIGVALIGIITVPILFYTVKDFFGKNIAWFATIVYVFSDVVIRNTRFSWNPNPMPLVIILMLWSANKIYLQKKYKFLLLFWLCFSIGMQLHYMILLIAPFMVIFMVMLWIDGGGKSKLSFNWNIFVINKDRKEILKYFTYSLGILLLFLSPLIIFDFRHNFLNLHGFLDFFETGDHSPHDLLKTMLEGQARLYQMLGLVLGFESWQKIRDYLSILISGVFIIRFIRNKFQKKWWVWLSYFIFAWVGLTLYNGEVYEHYLGFVYPLAFVFLGAALDFFWSYKNKVIKYITLLLLFIVIYKNVLNYQEINPLGWNINNTRILAQQIAKDSGHVPFNILLFDDSKDYRGMNYRYFWEINHSPILSLEEFNSAKILYIISQYPLENFKNFETRELEDFLGERVINLNIEQNQQLKSLIVKDWSYNGYYIYKLRKQ